MSRKTKALEARRLNMVSAQSMSDDQAANMPGMYPEWSKDSVDYGNAEEGQPVIVRYAGQLWRCISPHTSQESWAPGSAPSLLGGVLRSRRGVARMEAARRSS